jgi:hypothetical protein
VRRAPSNVIRVFGARHGRLRRRPHAWRVEALDRRVSGVANARYMAWTIFTDPRTAIGTVARHGDVPLQHQRLQTARSTLRKKRARAVQQIAHAPPRDVQTAAHRAAFVRTLEAAQDLPADGVLTLRNRIETGRNSQKTPTAAAPCRTRGRTRIGIFRGADQPRR